MRRRALALALAVLASAAQAGDRLPVREVRFSADGRQVMAGVNAPLDGSGFDRAVLEVLSTTTGKTLYRTQLTREEGFAHTKLLISPPTPEVLSRTGLLRRPDSRPRYQRRYPSPFPQWSDALGAGERATTFVSLWTKAVPIKLEVFPLPSTCAYPDLLPPGEGPSGFRLTVGGQLVHEDRTLPQPRACAARYALERVDVQGNRALFTLRAYGPGFEGPNADPVFVATTLR